MEKTKIYLIGAIFGFLATIGFLIIMISVVGVMSSVSNTANGGRSIGPAGQVSVLAMIGGGGLITVGGIGSFVSGIIMLVKSEEHPNKTTALLAGIFSILMGVLLVGPIMATVAHVQQKK